jgi:DNA modification methylase
MPIQGFYNLNTGKTKGKTLDAVLKSRNSYNGLILHFGGKHLLPSSVMVAKRNRVTAKTDAPGAERSYTATSPLVKAGKEHSTPKRLRAAFKISGSGAAAGNISTFWQDVGRSMVLLYTNPGDTVVDPFAGHNSRMELCVRAGRHYIGHDLSKEFMKFNRKRADELREEFNNEVNITLFEGDSRKLQAGSRCGDFTITSPPYWDIEDYGDEPEQLGKNTYEGFIEGMQQVMNENYRVLKPGAYAAWFVNDFRKGNKFYPYHYDIMTLAENAGFHHHDMLIVDLGRGFGDVFINQYVSQRRLPKRHEYGIIFRKPEKKKK